MGGERQVGGRARRTRPSILVATTALPLLAACSSSCSVDYAADAFPSQSLADLLKPSKDSPPPAQSGAPPPPAAADAALPAPTSAAPPAPQPPPVPATVAAGQPPAAASPPQESDPVAAAYPSVSLIDLLAGSRKPDSQ